jgi:hypothetical protein
VAGVPANFTAFLLFGWFVKRYKSWSAFVAAAVCFVTLGNLIAGASVVEFMSLPTRLVLGFTVFWNIGAIPAVIIGVPILVRATAPLLGRSGMLRYTPAWSANGGWRQRGVALVFSLLFVLLGGVIFLAAPGSFSSWPGLAFYFGVAAVIMVIFGPIANVLAGKRTNANRG